MVEFKIGFKRFHGADDDAAGDDGVDVTDHTNIDDVTKEVTKAV